MEKIKCFVCGDEFDGTFCPRCGTARDFVLDMKAKEEAKEKHEAEGYHWWIDKGLVGTYKSTTEFDNGFPVGHGDEEAVLEIKEDGSIRFTILYLDKNLVHLAKFSVDRPNGTIAFKAEDGGFFGQGTASQPAASGSINIYSKDVLIVRAEMMPHPIQYAGFIYYVKRVNADEKQ